MRVFPTGGRAPLGLGRVRDRGSYPSSSSGIASADRSLGRLQCSRYDATRASRVLSTIVVAFVLLASSLGSSKASGLDPISGFVIKSVASVVLSGVLGAMTNSPDPNLEMTKSIRSSLRNIHADILTNRAVIIEGNQILLRHLSEFERALDDLERRLNQSIVEGHERERVRELVASSTALGHKTALLREFDDSQHNETEYKHTVAQVRKLREDLALLLVDLENVGFAGAQAVLPAVSAIRADWNALTELPDVNRTREYALRTYGVWLDGQRYPTGASKPADMNLADLIALYERRLRLQDVLLAEASSPCGWLWKGKITPYGHPADQFTDEVHVKKIEMSILRLPTLEQASLGSLTSATEEVQRGGEPPHLFGITLTRETVAVTGELIVRDWEPYGPSSTIHADIHAHVNGCAEHKRTPTRVLRRLIEIGLLRGSSYPIEQGMTHATHSYRRGGPDYPIADWDISRMNHPRCYANAECRDFWNAFVSRRNIEAIFLATLYFIRGEVNLTLEGLAKEAAGADCTYFLDEPRVCVWDEEQLLAEVSSPEHTTNKMAPQATERTAWRVANDMWEAEDAREAISLGGRRDIARATRASALEHQWRELSKRKKEIEMAYRFDDQHLIALGEQAQRGAYMRLFFGLMIHQIAHWFEAAVDAEMSKTADSQSEGSEAEPVAVRNFDEGLLVSNDDESIMALFSDPLIDSVDWGDDEAMPTTTVTNNAAGTLFDDSSRASPATDIKLYIPDYPTPTYREYALQHASNWFAGFGESFSLGFTRIVQRWTGGAVVVDRESGAFKEGIMVGRLNLAPIAALKAGQIFRATWINGNAGKRLILLYKRAQDIGGKRKPLLSFVARLSRLKDGKFVYSNNPTISLVFHNIRTKFARLGFDPIFRLGHPGRLATRIPHFHVPFSKLHLPWEVPLLTPSTLSLFLHGDTHVEHTE